MKKYLIAFSFLLTSLSTPSTTACSIVSNYKADFGGASKKTDVAPKAPTASVDQIIRGGDMGDSCDDIAILTVKVPIEKENPAFAYKFKLVSGEFPKNVIHKYAMVGAESEGNNIFVFSWLEYGPAPFNITLSITAYSKNGKRGGTTLLNVSDNGR